MNTYTSANNVRRADAFRIPAAEVLRRIAALQAHLQSRGLAGALLFQRIDMLYFSGTAQSGYLFIPDQGAATLFIRRHLPRARAESPLEHILPIDSLSSLPGLLHDCYGAIPEVLGLEFDVLPVRTYRYLQSLFPGIDLVDASLPVHRTRMIKSEWELEQLALTAALSCQIFDYVRTAIAPGITEIDLSGRIEAFARKIGHSGGLRNRDCFSDLYSGHILSGASGGRLGHLDSPASGSGTSVAFPCGAGYKQLAAHEPIMIDFGTVLNGYHMDETRMFSIGQLPDEADRACRAAIEIFQAILEAVRPGVTMDALFSLAVETARVLGFGDQFLGPPGYKTTFIGHGVGLELVEPPIIARGRTEKLKPGMVLAIEPKMVFENRFCTGIESMITVTETGGRLISRVPEEIFIC
jgi:Xaa-Pro dipeptidase